MRAVELSPRGFHDSSPCSKKITTRVTLVGGPELSDGQDCLVYLIAAGPGELVLIDTGAGPSWPRISRNISDAGHDPQTITTLVLTHCHVDHIGAAAAVVRTTGCRVVAHELDAAAIESGDPRRTASSWYGIDLPRLTVTQRVTGPEETLTLGDSDLRLIHSPGHTPGSLAVLFEDEGQKVLFGQDIHGPFLADFGSDLTAWRRSMALLLRLEADILCEGHYGIFQPAGEARRFIEGQLATH